MLGRRLALLVGVLLSVTGGVLVLGGASAFALNERIFSGYIGSAGSGNGQLLEPTGVAVNASTHDVYVADRGHGRVEVFSPAGGYVGQFDGSAAPTGVFTRPNAMAVDNSGNALDPSAGDVYVVDSGHDVIDKFTAEGTYLGQITETTGGAVLGELVGIAVDANGILWVYQVSGENVGVIDSFSDALSNEYLSKRETPLGANNGIAVDSEDNLYVKGASGTFAKLNSAGEVLVEEIGSNSSSDAAVDPSNGEVFISELKSVGAYSSSGSFIERFGREQGVEHLSIGAGVAVDPTSGVVYVADFASNVVAVFTPVLVPDVTTGAASGSQATSATVSGTVNPDGVQLSDCRFEYGTSTAYGQSVPCVPAAGSIPADSSGHAVSASLTGIVDGATYHYRLRAGNNQGSGFGEDATFQTPPLPAIDSASAANVTGSSADLRAGINPRGVDTTYRFEWGTSTAYGTSVPVPDGDIGAGSSGVTVSTHVSSLSTNTTYHWRVVAKNANGTVAGGDHTFIYSTSGAAGLPDNRAYEMVTPPAKNAALVGDTFGGLSPVIAEDGSRVIMTSIQCFADAASCPAVESGSTGSSFEFTRTGGDWATNALAPPAAQFDRDSVNAVNADTGYALYTMPSPAGEWDWYARRPDGSFVDIGPTAPPASRGGIGSLTKYAETLDLSHLVFGEGVVTWPFDETVPSRTGESFPLYEYVGLGNTAPAMVGVSGGKGSTDLISKCGTRLGNGVDFENGDLSSDGRTVFFTALPCASGVNAGVEVPASELYARVDESRTVSLSSRSPLECTSSSGCLGSLPSDAEFVAASADGSRAFFLDTQQLADNASEDSRAGDNAIRCRETASTGCNLYEYDFARPAGRNLVAVSAGDSSGGGPRVQGVLAYSTDGSHVYFLARGVLTHAANERGQTAQDGAENLYVFEQDASHAEGRVSFITELSERDGEEWGPLHDYAANVTPDGRFLVFMSHGALTADDSSATGAVQVFRYDAQTGRLVRVSIGEGGFNDNGNAGVGNAMIAHQMISMGARRTDPTMSHDGAYVFFESPVALTPGALDDVPIAGVNETWEGNEPAYAENVYEWHEGHVYLLSDGRDVSANHTAPCYDHQSSVCLLGTDATGYNVFFTTTDSLMPSDTDTALDVYDARICTTGEPCIPPTVAAAPACQGEACHGTPGVTPAAPGAATIAFSGPGNLAPAPPASRKAAARKAPVKCAKGRRSKHGRCVKTRRMKKAKAKRAKATHGGQR